MGIHGFQQQDFLSFFLLLLLLLLPFLHLRAPKRFLDHYRGRVLFFFNKLKLGGG